VVSFFFFFFGPAKKKRSFHLYPRSPLIFRTNTKQKSKIRYNAYRFLVQSTRRWEAAQPTQPASFSPDPAAAAASPNVLDRWVAASAADLARFVRAEMGAHRLYTVVPRLTAFIDELTNVYVRYNRPRLKGTVVEEDEEGGEGEGEKGSAPPNDQLAALSTLHSVLSTLALVMCPFTPFFCEALWRNLRRAVPDAWAWPESVHWADFPDPGPPGPGDEAVRAGVGLMQSAIELARGVREKHSLPLKQPLRRLTLIHRDPAALAGLTPDLRAYILSEANVAEIVDCADVAAWTAGRAVPDWAGLGARLGPRIGAVAGALKAAGPDLLAAIEDGQAITVAGVELGPGDVSVARTFVRPKAAAAPGGGGGGSGGSEGAPAPDGAGDPASGLFVALDLTVDDALAAAGTAREVATRVQKARKTAGLVAGEAVDVWLGGGSGGGGGEGGDGGAAATASAPAPPLPPALAAALEAQAGWVTATLGRAPRPLADLPPGRAELVREAHAVGAGDFVLVLTRPE
jgi:isoleucyl-tRNA synthetase